MENQHEEKMAKIQQNSCKKKKRKNKNEEQNKNK